MAATLTLKKLTKSTNFETYYKTLAYTTCTHDELITYLIKNHTCEQLSSYLLDELNKNSYKQIKLSFCTYPNLNQHHTLNYSTGGFNWLVKFELDQTPYFIPVKPIF